MVVPSSPPTPLTKTRFPLITMNASTTRRQMIASAAALLGAGLVARSTLGGASVRADGITRSLDEAARAFDPAQRLELPDRLSFPVQLPCDIVVLDNFGGPRTFGGGAHRGIDIGRRDQQPGQPVVACIGGVLAEQEILGSNQGNSWVLQAANGFAYRYHHLADFAPGLRVGDVVMRDQVIGTMGSTGNPNVAHLHFEVRQGGPIGSPVDPLPLLPLPLPGVAVI